MIHQSQRQLNETGHRNLENRPPCSLIYFKIWIPQRSLTGKLFHLFNSDSLKFLGPLNMFYLLFFGVFFSCFFIFERETECEQGRGREGDTELEAASRICAVSTEPDVGLEPTSHEIMTWAEVRCFNWLSHPGAPQVGYLKEAAATHGDLVYFNVVSG